MTRPLIEDAELGDASLEPVSRPETRDLADELPGLPDRLGTSHRVRLARSGILVVSDTAVVAIVSTVAVLLWASVVRDQPLWPYERLLPLLALFPIAYMHAGLYPGFGLGPVEVVRRLLVRTTMVFIVIAAFSFIVRAPQHYARMTFFLAWGGTSALLPIVHFAMRSLLARAPWAGEPMVVIGTGSDARRTIEALRDARSVGYEPRWVLSLGRGAPDTVVGLPVVGELDLAPTLADRGARVALVVVEEPDRRGEIVQYLQEHFRHVLLMGGPYGSPVEGVEVRNLGGALCVEFENQLLKRRNRIVKRLIDLVGSSIGLLGALPIIGLAAASIKLVDPGPAFFAQKREGLEGKEIRVWKLRTMYTDAERRLERHLSTDPAARREWEERFKLTDDPRILPVVGKPLRRFSIDELPQLWNVLKGDMSLVGPRPFPEYHLRSLSPHFRTLRSRVRPGLTGLWQVSIRARGGIDDQETYDTYFITNWSVWMDLYILARTFGAVLAARGAY